MNNLDINKIDGRDQVVTRDTINLETAKIAWKDLKVLYMDDEMEPYCLYNHFKISSCTCVPIPF